MPNDKPETLAAILAEMRKAVVPMICGRPKIEAVSIRDVLQWADRIEAAYKREHAEWHGETNAAKEARNRIACKMRYEFAAKCRACKAEPGSAAAMRDALEWIVNLAPEYPARGVDWNALAADAFLTASAALAKPARNCDVGTAEEQAERFKQFCLDNHSAEHLCSRCPLGKRLGNDVDMCQLHWAQMPYAPAEGGAE